MSEERSTKSAERERIKRKFWSKLGPSGFSEVEPFLESEASSSTDGNITERKGVTDQEDETPSYLEYLIESFEPEDFEPMKYEGKIYYVNTGFADLSEEELQDLAAMIREEAGVDVTDRKDIFKFLLGNEAVLEAGLLFNDEETELNDQMQDDEETELNDQVPEANSNNANQTVNVNLPESSATSSLEDRMKTLESKMYDYMPRIRNYRPRYRRYPQDRSHNELRRNQRGEVEEPSTASEENPADLPDQELKGKPVEFEMRKNLLLVGKTAAGKTQFILQYLRLYYEYFDRVVIYSTTAKNDPDYHEFRELDKAEGLNRMKIYDTFDEDAMVNFLEAKADKNSQIYDTKYLIIFDDVLSLKNLKMRGNAIKGFLSTARHHEVTSIFSVQEYSFIPPVARANVGYIALFKLPENEMEKVAIQQRGRSGAPEFLTEAKKITKKIGRALFLNSKFGYDWFEISIDKFEGVSEEIQETDYPIRYVKNLFKSQDFENEIEVSNKKIKNRKNGRSLTDYGVGL